MTKIILASEINNRKDELHRGLFGIGKESAPIRLGTLTEAAYSGDHYDENNMIIKHAITGKDYHKDLETLHKHVRPYLEDEETHNAPDNYIHDTLKRGKPSGETVKHILDVAGNTLDDNSRYLRHKWGPFIHHYAAEKPKITKPEEAGYTPEELNQIPSNMTLGSLRLLKHPTEHFFEMHPHEGLRYLGHTVPVINLSHDYARDRHDFRNLDAEMTEQYKHFTDPAIKHYTTDSRLINLHLHGVVSPYTDADEVHETNRISDDITKLFHRIPHPSHAADFKVYTGMHSITNPSTVTEEDEHGNKLIHSPAFTSTSIHQWGAETFANMKHDPAAKFPLRDVMEISVPGGYPHGAYIKPNSEHEHEYEYLLDKGHTFVVHPKPHYYTGNGALYRMWKAKIHPRDQLSNREWGDLDTHEKVGIALDPNAEKSTLNRASTDSVVRVRAAAAKHPKIDQYDLERLSKDDTPSVREAAMMNPSIPSHIIHRAFTEMDPAMQRGIAKRKTLDASTMQKLHGDGYASVSRELAKRTDLSDEHIETLLNTTDHETKMNLARNVSLKPEPLSHLIANNVDITREVARNPSTSKHQLVGLKNHNDSDVRHAARINPRNWMLE